MINKRYTKSPEINVNYDFADILSDVGYVTLYGMSDENSNFILSRLTVDSTDVRSTKGETGNIERNFDYEFLLTQHVKGELIVTLTLVTSDTGTGSTTNDTTVEIFHVRDGTETTIGTQQAIGQRSTAGTEYYRTSLTFDVDKVFKKGDIIRVEVISTVAGNAAGDIAGFYHDPTNRSSITDQHGGNNSDFIVQIPFKLNL